MWHNRITVTLFILQKQQVVVFRDEGSSTQDQYNPSSWGLVHSDANPASALHAHAVPITLSFISTAGLNLALGPKMTIDIDME